MSHSEAVSWGPDTVKVSRVYSLEITVAEVTFRRHGLSELTWNIGPQFCFNLQMGCDCFSAYR